MSDEVRTLCPYCGVGCGLIARRRGDRIAAVEGDPIHPVNRGRTCRKPLELASAVHAADRATAPLLREQRDLRFRETSWDDAIARLAARLRAIVTEHGPDAVAFYISGQLLSEDYYAVNKLAKGFLGTNNVDSNSRLCMSSAVAGYSGAFGYDGPPPAYADIGLADCLLLLGTNTAACHPIVWSRIRERRAEGACVICVDPRPTQTARESTLHLPVRPGTDLALLSAMLHVIDRDGLLDEAFLARSTSGWEEAREVARGWSPRRAGEVCGVEPALIEEAARRFGAGPRSMALWSMGANQSRVGTLKNRALINLCLASGQIGRAGTGPLSLTGQPNAMGGRETGGLAHLLPGYRRVDDEGDRAEMARLWRLDESAAGISPRPGLPAVELFDALRDGRVKAVWIVATNPAVSLPDSGRAREALERAELVVVQDAHHPTETSALADAVLPAAAWPEKQGTMTNSERRVGLVRKLLESPGEALPDWRIFARLAQGLGYGEHFAWRGPDEVFAEFAACTAGRPCDLSGIDHERLASSGGLQWPCPDPRSPGTERLYETGRFPTADGRARFAPTPPVGPAEAPDHEYPLTLTTGRLAEHWHTLSRTGKSARLMAAASEPWLELNPVDAERIGVREGSRARVVSRRGEAIMRVSVAEGLREGVVFAPFHWGARHAPPGAGQANMATIGVTDPISKQPELKAAAVRVEPVADTAVAARRRSQPRRLLVIGSGMAALETVEEVLRRTEPGAWRVTMLGEEPGLPYNRMLLSKLLAEEIGAAALDLRPPAWFAKHGIEVRGGCPATRIDPEHRRVLAGDGGAHRYDALVIATGSRPFVPPIPGASEPGVLTFRAVADVAAIERAADAARRAVVIGGGLLGLEAAAGLRRHGVGVTVVEAAPHLMPQQLDPVAAAMLATALEGLGIGSACGVGVERCAADRVTLADGREIEAELTVVAAGVRPEASLAADAGIEVSRGIVVDDEMRTSAPSVWAVGECAEHRGTVYGLWAPVAAQARVAGASLSGDPAAFHREVPATNLKVAGIDLFAGGGDGGGDELVWIDRRRGVYRRLVLDGERLAAAALLGDVSGARELSALLRSGEAVPERLLAPPGAAVEPPTPEPGDVVCSCNAVTRGEIEAAIRARALRSAPAVGRETRAGTGCGSCVADIEAILREQDSSTRNTDVTDAKRLRSRMPA